MNRKDFLKRLALGSAGAAVAPQVIAEVSDRAPEIKDIHVRATQLKVDREVLSAKFTEHCAEMRERIDLAIEEWNKVFQPVSEETKSMLRSVSATDEERRMHENDYSKFK